MRPKLFRLKDLLLMFVPILATSLVIAAFIWNYTSPDGEPIPYPGWIVSSLMILGFLVIAFMFYYKRHQFISMWKYQTVDGINCYFESDARIYLKMDVEKNTREMFQKFNNTDFPVPENALVNTICMFKKPLIFEYRSLNWGTRLVYGISGWNWAMVGQGDRPIEGTAFAHEMAHVHIGKTGFISELEAHEFFSEIGI